MCKHCHYKKPNCEKIPLEIFENGFLHYLISMDYDRLGITAYYSANLTAYVDSGCVIHKRYVHSKGHWRIINDIMTYHGDLEREKRSLEKTERLEKKSKFESEKWQRIAKRKEIALEKQK